MNENEAMGFITEQVLSWVGNLMRDLDAQGIAISLDNVATAVSNAADELLGVPDEGDFDEFLRDLNDGRGSE